MKTNLKQISIILKVFIFFIFMFFIVMVISNCSKQEPYTMITKLPEVDGMSIDISYDDMTFIESKDDNYYYKYELPNNKGIQCIFICLDKSDYNKLYKGQSLHIIKMNIRAYKHVCKGSRSQAEHKQTKYEYIIDYQIQQK